MALQLHPLVVMRIDKILVPLDGLGRLILGSVAESLLRGARTPIIALRATDAPGQPPEGLGRVRPGKKGFHA